MINKEIKITNVYSNKPSISTASAVTSRDARLVSLNINQAIHGADVTACAVRRRGRRPRFKTLASRMIAPIIDLLADWQYRHCCLQKLTLRHKPCYSAVCGLKASLPRSFQSTTFIPANIVLVDFNIAFASCHSTVRRRSVRGSTALFVRR